MCKTNSGLVAYAKAQVGLPYWYGTYGQTATASLYSSKRLGIQAITALEATLKRSMAKEYTTM